MIEQAIAKLEQKFNEMSTLCENKVNKALETMFDELCVEFKFTKESAIKQLESLQHIEEERDELEQAERVIEEAKEKLDEEMAKYEQIKQHRANRRLQHGARDQTTDASDIQQSRERGMRTPLEAPNTLQLYDETSHQEVGERNRGTEVRTYLLPSNSPQRHEKAELQ